MTPLHSNSPKKDNLISRSVWASTIEDLKNAVAEVIRFEEAQSLQTWMASDPKIKQTLWILVLKLVDKMLLQYWVV